jgi:hypothetical protein
LIVTEWEVYGVTSITLDRIKTEDGVVLVLTIGQGRGSPPSGCTLIPTFTPTSSSGRWSSNDHQPLSRTARNVPDGQIFIHYDGLWRVTTRWNTESRYQGGDSRL